MYYSVGMKFLLLTVVGLSACAQNVGDIDRTQPNKINKSALTGEWYYRPTVIDVPYATGFTFVGEQGPLERGTFDISENYLTFNRGYEFVRDSEAPYVPAGTRFVGAPIAQFKILSHFDIERTYNPATGEQGNVIEENTTDRPWNERQYMRVDWSTNLVSDYEFTVARTSQTQTAYEVTDPTDPDHWFVGVRDTTTNAWRDVRDDGAVTALTSFDYLDLVSQVQMKPETVDYYGDGSFILPACYFFEVADCASSTVKIRHSFMKVPASDYEPLSYPDNQLTSDAQGNPLYIDYFDKFGFFRTERDSYDPNYGVTETGRIYLANRWNIWQKSKLADGTTIPYNQRKIKPIDYYLSPGFPADLKPGAQALVADWTKPLQDVAGELSGGALAGQTMINLHDNDYSVGADGRINNYGERAGDLRFSQIYYVSEPQLASPLGYGPAAADPVTGEIIQANAFIYGAALETETQFGTDVVNLLNNNISTNELVSGQVTQDAVLKQLTTRGYHASINSKADLSAKLGPNVFSRLTAARSIGKDALLKDPTQTSSRLAALDSHPELVSPLLNADILANLRQDPTNTSPATTEELANFSPSHWLTRSALDKENGRIDKLARSNCIYMADFADDATLGLARSLAQQGGDIHETIRQDIFQAVAAHEVGHTLGLRHNFEGSYDAFNFNRTFWDLKGTPTPLSTQQTQDQINGRMSEYQYSSIMDYGARFNSDIHGIGRYDKAAIKFGYGQIVETLSHPPPLSTASQRMFLVTGLTPNFLRFDMNYSSLPTIFGSVDNFDQRTDVPYAQVIAGKVSGAPSVLEVPYLFCSDEYAGGTPSCARFDAGMDPHEIVVDAADRYEHYYFFNSFKRDRRYFSPSSYLNRIFSRYFEFFVGEYQQWVFRNFNDAPFWTFLGQIQDCYNGNTSPATVTACTDLEPANFWDGIKGVLNGQPMTLVNKEDWNVDVDGGGAYSAASLEALNEIFAVMSRPAPGDYVNQADFATTNTPWLAQNHLTNVTTFPGTLQPCVAGQSSLDLQGNILCGDGSVALGDGRYPYSDYDVNSGYDFFEKVLWVGSFYDKLAGIVALTDPNTNFLGVDTTSDVRRYAIGFNLLFPDLLYNHFSNIFSQNLPAYAPRLAADGSLQLILPYSSTDATDSLLVDLGSLTIPPDLATAPMLDASNDFTVRLYTLLFGMADFSATFDPGFLNASQVCVRGNGECSMEDSAPCDNISCFDPANLNCTAATTCYEMTDPLSQKTYRSLKSAADVTALSKAAQPDLLGAANKQMLYLLYQKAQAYKDAVTNPLATDPALPLPSPQQQKLNALQSDLTTTAEDVEIMRGFYRVFGYL